LDAPPPLDFSHFVLQVVSAPLLDFVTTRDDENLFFLFGGLPPLLKSNEFADAMNYDWCFIREDSALRSCRDPPFCPQPVLPLSLGEKDVHANGLPGAGSLFVRFFHPSYQKDSPMELFLISPLPFFLLPSRGCCLRSFFLDFWVFQCQVFFLRNPRGSFL